MTKRILLTASHVIGFDGKSHVIWRDGEVVFEGSHIIFVGRGFGGRVDERIDYGGAMIGPGFIDLDALGDLDSTVLTLDNGPDWTLGRIWTEAYLREGPREAYTFEEGQFKYRYAFTQLIRNGITTAMPITSMSYRQWGETYEEFAGVAGIAAELGIRAYLGPCYMSGISITDDNGNISQHWDEAKGLQGLQAAERYIRDFDGKADGLIHGFLAPDRIETCTPALLARTADISREANVRVRLHCCQSPYDVALVEKLRGTSAYRWLDGIGLLNSRAVLPHGIYLQDGDLELLAASGASLVHCPIVFARDGEALRSFASYRALGINIAMGTDTSPPDMVDNLRQGLNLCRVVDGANTASAADFYNAATLGGAAALGRDDIGRLCAGALADITVFDLTGLHLGPIMDPVKTMVLAGTGRDFTHAWISGRQVMTNRALPGVDEDALRVKAQAQFEQLQNGYSDRAPGRPSTEQLFKPSFPIAG